MKKTSIGGQALIEGLMMIGPENAAVSVRKPDGEIVTEKWPLPKKNIFSKVPVIRGAVGFFKQMVLGVKALMYSAEFVDLEDEQEKPSKFDKFFDKIFGDKLKDAAIYFSVIVSIAFSIGLFVLVPNAIASFLNIDSSSKGGVVLLNLIEGLIRVSLFFCYLILASKMNDIKRVWQYHGAEHKTIHCYEHGEKLTVDNVKKHSTKHPRCGTSFLFLVMIISIIVFSFFKWYGVWLNILIRILFIPFVAGISYELLKFAGRRSEWKIMKIINAPGMFFQLFTTKEPDDSMIEVAIEAFNNVRVDDGNADNW